MLPANWKPCAYCGRPHASSAEACTRCRRYFSTGRLSRTGRPALEVACANCGLPNYDYRERCWKCLTPLQAPVQTGVPAAQTEAPATPVAASPIAPSEPVPVPPALSQTATPKPAAPQPAPVDTAAEEEVRALTSAIEGGQADSSTFELRASYLIALGRLDLADADLEHLEDPVRRDVLRGDIAAARGNLSEAADHYEAALADQPGSTSLARKLARLYVRHGSLHPDHVDHVRRTLDSQFDALRGGVDWIAWVTFLHERYAASERWDEEIDLLRQVSTVNPPEKNPRLGLWLVDALLERDHLDEAALVADRLTLSTAHPAVVAAHLHIGRAFVRRGDTDLGRERYLRLADATENPEAAQMSEMLEHAPPGQRFVPLERIGSGAVAEVWRAFDLFTRKLTALKILHESLTSDSLSQEELRQEYEVMAESLAPRLARVIPGSLQPDRFAMDLLDRSLVDLLEEPEHERGLPIRQAVAVAREVSEGLEYLHARGIVYQDLSPQNVLFQNGRVKLIDFGGARQVGHSGSAATVAKVAYASPEQCALLMGDLNGTVDGRSDTYSLGVLLYQMLTGRLPFEGPDQAVLHAHLYSSAAPPVLLRPEIGRDLNRVVLRCMAREPADRYGSPAELFDTLGEAVVD